MCSAAVVHISPGLFVGFGMKVASPIALPGGWRFSGDSVGVMECCVEDLGVVVDGVVVSLRLVTEGADEAAVGVCRPVFAVRNLRSRSRFLGFWSDISRDFAEKWMIRTGVSEHGLDASE